MGSSLKIEIKGIDNLIAVLAKKSDDVTRNVVQQVFNSANNIRNEAQNTVHVSPVQEGHAPGRLKNSIGVNYDNDGLTATVSTDVEYAPYIEFGTSPHIIRPKSAKVLSWIGSDGERKFSKEVHHPGTKPYPFMAPAAEQERPNFESKMKSIVG